MGLVAPRRDVSDINVYPKGAITYYQKTTTETAKTLVMSVHRRKVVWENYAAAHGSRSENPEVA